MKKNIPPSIVRATREQLGLTQEQAAELIFFKRRVWQLYEQTFDPKMHKNKPAAMRTGHYLLFCKAAGISDAKMRAIFKKHKFKLED